MKKVKITLNTVRCCLPVFLLRCWSRVILLKKTRPKLWGAWIGGTFGALALLLFAESVLAAPCDLRSSPPPFIRNDLTNSYCELCGYGYVTIIVSNPYEGANMIDMTVVEDLRSSGLTFDSSAPTPVRVNGISLGASSYPNITGVNNQILTWDSGQIAELGILAHSWWPLGYNTISITFAVTRATGSGFNQEGLVSVDRDIQASLTYSTVYEIMPPTIPQTYDSCPGTPRTVPTGLDTLPLREPDPAVIKGGRNVDAAQGSYASTVYGNDKDDVIWRIRVTNNGDVDLQDLVFDDVMATSDNLNINYICATEAAAESVALAGNGAIGTYPGCTDVRVLNNSFTNYDVDDPFGYDDPGSDLIDVLQSLPADIFLVGKIPDSAPGIGACSTARTNTVSNLQWGCETESATPGGIDRTTTGSPLADVTATLSGWWNPDTSNTNLTIDVDYIGYPGNPVTGARGRVRITITNPLDSTVMDLWLRNDLPPEYVVDATHPVTIAATGAYGYYPGLTNQISWDNLNGNPLLNNIPEFTLTSSEATNSGQTNMLRNGDQVVITFGIILVRPESYDDEADLDVVIESPSDNTDPDHATSLNNLENTLTVQYDNFCAAGATIDTDVSDHTPDPEDLDIETYGPSGPVLDYILTNNDALTLTVVLTNNGGHGAEDYYAYATFGRTMVVDESALPVGCSATLANRPPLVEWQDPLGLPAGASIYECTGSEIGRNGGQLALDFIVSKSTDPADIAADDLTFRADVIGEITLFDGTRLTFPTIVARGDGITDRANNYSIDAIRARVMGFNLNKAQVGNCSENNPPPGSPDLEVQIGEECSYNIEAGGWFGFLTPGYTPIEVRNVRVDDVMPNGQGYVSSTDPEDPPTTAQIDNIAFNRVGGPVPPNWSLLGDLLEGTLYWTFNDAGSYITTRDQWFELDMRTRLLNDPIDTSGVPNQQAALSTNTLTSTFDVYFLAGTGNEFDFTYGPSMSVYPPVADRQVSLTVTEPDITVVKEVCNESLYGSGPGCSNFVPLADDGDALNNYIYRLTVTNEASSGGVDRAPAYDVTVTDTLNASDLAYVVPFGGDGLNNDGDGATDGADAGGEGAISDNTVDNGTPAVITFSHTHSNALLRIDAGDSVQLYYRVDFDDDAAPLQTFTNTADATYDSLEGASGNQTSGLERPNSNIAGARVYTSPSDSAVVQIIPVETQPKRIAVLSNTPLAGAGTQGVSIGEEVEYRLNTLLPVALLRSFVIRDELPSGIRCSEAPAVNLDALPYSAAGFDPGGTITPTCTDSLVEWNFGDQRITSGTAGLGGRFDFEIGFIARVENTAGTNNGNVISNGVPATNATARYIDEVGSPVTQNFNQVDIQVTEPLITLTKAFAVANADADDILTVTVTATNTGTATGYNLRVLDNLDGLNLTYIGNVSGSNPPDNVDTTTQGANQPIFSWNPPNGIDVGNSISFTFEIQVDDVVQPQEILDNTIQADWTSLPGQTTALNSSGLIGSDGSATGMRNGALPNAGDAINDYETTAANQVTVPALTLTKTDLDPGVIPSIGERKTFQIDIILPETVTNDVIVTDSLDTTGLSYILENNAVYDITYTFQGIATINGLALDEASFNAFPTDGASGSIVWDIGTVVTQTENDTSINNINPFIRIQYYARVNNDLVTDSGDSLQNGVVVNYTNGETGVQETLTDASAAVTVVEPLLAAAKTVSNVSPGKQPADPPEGGDRLEYVIAILNSGTSTAYDVNVVDTLPATLSLYTGFTPTATISGTAVTGFVATPANSPSGPLIWGSDNGDGSLDIPVGQSLLLTYRAVVQAAGGDISNSVMVDWSSLDGASNDERDGDGCPNWTAPDDYCTGPAVATTTTVDNNSVDKTVTADTFDTAPWSTAGDAIVRIGDFITYRLSLNLSGGLTQNLVAQDTLPGGMVFVETVSINGDTTVDYTPPSSGAGSNFSYAAITAANVPTVGQVGALTWTIGNVVNDPFGDPTTDAIEIIYRARILPDAGIAQAASTPLTNTVNMDYETTTGPAVTQTDSATVTVVQPVLVVAKSAVADGGDTVLASDEIVTYTVDIVNSGGAPAYDPQLTDIIPVGMRNGTATITTVTMELLSGTVLPNLAPTYDAATGVVTWDFDTGIADQYAIPAGDTLRIVYWVQTDTSLSAGMTLTNEAQIQRYYSLDDDDIPTQGGVDGEAQIYGPTNIATVTFTTAAPEALVKDNPAVLNVAVGEPFTYRITVPATPQDTVLNDVRIIDDLSASAADLLFVSVTKVFGSEPWTPVNTGTAANLVIEDTTIGIDIPAGEQIIIDITVVLGDTATNVSGLQFNNTGDYTFNQINGDPASQTSGGSDTTENMTIVGADTVTLEKSGPAIVQLETPATYTLNFHNTSTGTVWNPTITDQIPNEATGGMCDAGPSNVTAQIFDNNGVPSPLVENTDFTVEFDGDPTCEWRFNLLSPAGGVPADYRLIINYDVVLDPDTENGITLTNLAGATRWYSTDPNVVGAAPRIFDRVITDGTPGILDHEDEHTITAEAPTLLFEMSVQNVTTGQDPGSNASPGDVLHYTIQIINSGPVGLSSFSIVDEVDGLNTTPAFASGSLGIISVPAGADTSSTDPAGGANGTGLLNIANLSIGAQGDVDDTLVVEFEVTLALMITSGTLVLNQAQIISANPNPILSDDPNVSGDTDPTETLIASTPAFEVQKTSTIMSGDPNILMAGETLRYTITIKNIGNEDAVNVSLRDYTPANTSYVANSTTLNGITVPDPSPGINPLNTGIQVNAPEDTTAGYLRAVAAPGATNVSTVTFDVVVDPNAMNGLIIENQGFVSGSGVGSGPQPEQPSDDPNTPIPDDPTRDVVGSLPLLYAHKTVALFVDDGSSGIVDSNDELRYTIVISNYGAVPATNVVLTDAVPGNTIYVADSLRLNGSSLGPDGGVSPLIAGLSVQSGDNPGAGIVSVGETAVITFRATVNGGVPTGTIIINQGDLTSDELPPALTDADGLAANGYQPTVIVVGDAQLLTITKEVMVVGGGPALAGGQLEYVIRVVNNGSQPATLVSVTDDLNPPLGTIVSYVAGSGTLNGAAAGVTYAGGILIADYDATYGDLPSGASAVVRFRVLIDTGLAIGTTITNTGYVHWNSPMQTASADVAIDVGGTPGSAVINGNVWHDANLDTIFDSGEVRLTGWTVTLYRNNLPVTTVLTDDSGTYRLSGLLPNEGTSDQYEIRFRARGAGPNAASLGDALSVFTNGPHRISDITVSSGDNLQDLNLPITPNGTVYNSIVRVPIAGATVTMLNAATGAPCSSGCFDDPFQQNQVTAAEGYYKFDLNFSDGACPAGGAYLIEVTPPPASGYMATPSQIIPPASDATTAPFSVPACPGSADDAVPATAGYCEVVASPAVPPVSVPPGTAGTIYHLHLLLSDGSLPGQSQIFNNPIPIDPEMDDAVAITKTTPKITVTRGTLVPYTITVTNVFGGPMYDLGVIDRFPAGFKYVAGSARLNGNPAEPLINGRELAWDGLVLQVNEKATIGLLLVVGSGVSEGDYVNRALVVNNAIGTTVSGESTATVRVIPDPDFDCTDVIGKVFDDRDLDGWQDDGEKGLAGVRVVTVRGLIATTDPYGRFHITCAAVPDEDHGSNLLLKLDERSLPSGFRLTTENPRVQRATRGKMIRFNFGATIYRVVRIDIVDGVFEPDTSRLRLQWEPKINQLLQELKKAPAILRLSYLADVERNGLVEKRLKTLKKSIANQWKQSDGGYPLTIETEVFWRRGASFNEG